MLLIKYLVAKPEKKLAACIKHFTLRIKVYLAVNL